MLNTGWDMNIQLKRSGYGPENFKKSRTKKLVKSNKSISRKKILDQNPFFAISKMAKNPFLNGGKSLKLNILN